MKYIIDFFSSQGTVLERSQKQNTALQEVDVRQKLIDANANYSNLFWLFMLGNVLGVVLEGGWCLTRYGHWETHVVTIWGPFCLIYGIGAVGFYIVSVLLSNKKMLTQFIAFALIGTVVEYASSALLEYGLHMRAWDYSSHFGNIAGRVSLQMALIWGALGVMFAWLAVPLLRKLFGLLQGKQWRTAAACVTVFMIVNITLTAVCLVHWKDRHEGVPPRNNVETFIDETYPDHKMEARFCEWSFLDEESRAGGNGRR